MKAGDFFLTGFNLRLFLSFFIGLSCLYAESYFSIESISNRYFLNSYESVKGFANLEKSVRVNHALLSNVNDLSVLEDVSFGKLWGEEELFIATPLRNKVKIEVFELNFKKEIYDLNRLSSLELTFPYGEIEFCDILSKDFLGLGYDQVELFVKSDGEFYFVTLVPDIAPGGQWRQSNWEKVSFNWPNDLFQLIHFQRDSYILFNLKKNRIESYKEGHELEFLLNETDNNDSRYIRGLENGHFELFDIERGGIVNYNGIELKRNKFNPIENSRKVIDLICIKGNKQKKLFIFNENILWTETTKRNLDNSLVNEWLREGDKFKVSLSFKYLKEEAERNTIHWRIWWKEKSPSSDLSFPLIQPDEVGVIRKPMLFGDTFSIETEKPWPYERELNKDLVSYQGHSNFWTIMVVSNEKEGWSTRIEYPWLSRPLKLLETDNIERNLELSHFMTNLQRVWRHSGGMENKGLFFEGFFNEEDLQNNVTYFDESIIKNFLDRFHPWKNKSKTNFDDLWVNTWNSWKDSYEFPKFYGNMELFKSWKLKVSLLSGDVLKKGTWSLMNEFDEIILTCDLLNGEVNVIESFTLDEYKRIMNRIWSAKLIKEVVHDEVRKRDHAIRHKGHLSGSEFLGHLWNDYGTSVFAKVTLPWDSSLLKWEPKSKFYFLDEAWLLELKDTYEGEVVVKTKVGDDYYFTNYRMEKGLLTIPINFNNQISQSFWVGKKKGADMTWSSGMKLPHLGKIKLIECGNRNKNFWLSEGDEKVYVFDGVQLEKSFQLPPEFKGRIKRAQMNLLGDWIFLLKKEGGKSELVHWSSKYGEVDQVLGRDKGKLNEVHDFVILKEDLEETIISGDITLNKLICFSLDWNVLSDWEKKGFYPSAIVNDPIYENEFWVLDRRVEKQSFLYHFEFVAGRINLRKVFLTSIPVGRSELGTEVLMTVSKSKDGERLFAFGDTVNNCIYEYSYDGIKLSKLNRYESAFQPNARVKLDGMNDIFYVNHQGDVGLYVLNNHHSVLSIR